MDLGSSFKNEVYSISLWNFLRFKTNLVLRVTKLTCPDLLLFSLILLNLTVLIENSLAGLTYNRITSGEFSIIFETAHRNLEDISVYLLSILALTFLLSFSS